MFEGDYTINGTHATYIKYLVNDVKAFDRYIDVYMAGAALGVLNDKRAKQGGSTDRARIYSDAFNTEHVKCNELFKVVILNDTSKSWSEEDRINICFKYRDKMDENAIPPISELEVEMMKEALDLFNELTKDKTDIFTNPNLSDTNFEIALGTPIDDIVRSKA